VTAILLSQEFAASRERFQRTLGISLALHVALFAWLMLREAISPVAEGIVEIAWLDPAPASVSAAPVPVQARPEPVVADKPVAPSPTEEKFERQQEAAVVEPTPQELTANRDKVKERMAALATTKLPNNALTAAPRVGSSLLKSAPVQAADPGQKAPPVVLDRAGNTSPRPATLKRGPVKSNRTAPALAPVEQDKSVGTAVAAPDLESVARRTLEGAELAGDIADRPVIEHIMPIYPEWAKSQAVEAVVTLYFVVLPDGRVKENIQIQKTAGFSDFDKNAIGALARWRFQALSGGAAHEQWGTITFRFRLRD
jgi:TonB family protein